MLDAATLTALRARAQANTPQWQALKSYCDSFIGGVVNYPDGATYPNAPDIGQGYEGDGYWAPLMSEGCHGSPLWSQTGIGVMEPVNDRRNGATA